MKNYILKHKDINVLKFSFNDKYEIDKIIEIYNNAHKPVNMLHNEVLSDTDALNDWWTHRTIPASRDKLEENLKKLNVETTKELLQKSYALSLTDHYWIMPEDKNITWHKINYYENDFSEDVGKILFDNTYNIKDVNTFSPDNSSDGNLKKKWSIEKDGTRVLIKGGDIYSPQESYNEVIAAELCLRLGINHAKYTILNDDAKKVFYSKSPNYTTDKLEFINANHIITSFNDVDTDKYNHFIDCCKTFGLERKLYEEDLNKMFLVDFIIANKDRHYRNFGFLRDSETLEWKGLAPVYDSGNSLFEGLADVDLENEYFLDSRNIEAKPFAENQFSQFSLLPLKKYCKNLPFNKLEDFSSWCQKLLSSNYRLSEKRKDLICSVLDRRIELTRRLILQGKDDLSDNNTKKHMKKQSDYDYDR